MNPYIVYKINGIESVCVSDDSRVFSAVGQEKIESVELLIVDYKIQGIKVSFEPDTVIDAQLEDSTYQIVSLFLANVIGQLDGIAGGLTITASKTHNPNLVKEDGVIRVSERLVINESLSIHIQYPIERFGELFSEIPTDESKKEQLVLFVNIMKIEDDVVRFLMQYEYLMTLVSPKHNQKEVTAFIRDQFNPSVAFNNIGFHPTRRPNCTNDEDDITYFRNQLAHSDLSSYTENKELKQTVALMNQVIKRVIFFRLNQLP